MRGTRTATRGLTGTEIVIVAVVAAVLVVVTAVSHSNAQPGEIVTAATVVAPADTIWSLAAANPVDGLTTAQTADLIIRINELGDGAAIAAGSTLLVPQSGQSQYAAR